MPSKNGKKPGFSLPKISARLEFEDQYEGAVVVVRTNVPMALIIEAQDVSDSTDIGTFAGSFIEHVLLDWNLENDGVPVEQTTDGFKSLPFDFVTKVLEAWSTAVATIPDPLSPKSESGNTSEKDQLVEMEV
jgi:hypothetical protein